jgi:hypothetical protein
MILFIGVDQSRTIYISCCHSQFFTLLKRGLFSVPTTIAETPRCDLVFRNFRLRQHLQLDFDVLHVAMSVTYQRPEINSFRNLATATKYKAQCVNRIHPRHRFAGGDGGLSVSV